MAELKINPGLRLIERRGTVQIGLGPTGLVLEGTGQGDLEFLYRLRTGLDDTELDRTAVDCAITPERAQALVAALESVLVEPPAKSEQLSGLRLDRLAPDRAHWSAVYSVDSSSLLADRARAAVHLIGLGRTGGAVACALAAAGVGTLLLEDRASVGPADVGSGAFRLADVGLNRAQAVRKMIRNIDPTVSTHILSNSMDPEAAAGRPRFLNLVIYTDRDVPNARISRGLSEGDNPHLSLLLRERDALIGPLVVPGQSACLDCLDRHHAQTDPDWYELCSQVHGASAETGAVDEVAQSVAAAGLASLQSLLFLDGRNRPAAWSAVLQLRSVDGAVGRHEYRPHPECACQLQPALQDSSSGSRGFEAN
ncbi:ThiF family adenylyltransferase [Crystallibacter degradans]|uniref:ThiF family adenylyltransferase n=1 Tax=Crystallibacter degradans TaxID=2726743 RepID=UPI001472B034|nr:hypothetical protein [Arthrobacter sp. SF27]